MISQLLKGSISKSGIPNWQRPFVLKPDQHYQCYDNQSEETHDTLFSQAATIIRDLWATLSDDKLTNLYSANVRNDMIHSIFGSNMIERAGNSLSITTQLCNKVFHGEEVDAAITEQDPSYKQQLQFLIEQGHHKADLDHVICSRREIIQHAKALQFIMDAALNKDQLITEDLILQTHRILCAGVPLATGETGYEGRYRTQMVSAGSTVFTAPGNVPREMGIFIQDFNLDVKNREETLEMDPFFLAADACQDFVTIHPFADGNGRMCRLIANAYLIKYAGVVISIGEDEEDRKNYLSMAVMAGDGETEEQARGTVARFFVEKETRALERLKENLDSGREA